MKAQIPAKLKFKLKNIHRVGTKGLLASHLKPKPRRLAVSRRSELVRPEGHRVGVLLLVVVVDLEQIGVLDILGFVDDV